MSPDGRRLAMAGGVLLVLILLLVVGRRHAAGPAASEEPEAEQAHIGLAAAQVDSSVLAPAATAAAAAVNPQFEICRNPALSTQSLSGLLGSDERERAYVDAQAQQLRRAAANSLLQSSDEERLMAGHLLMGDTVAAAQLAQHSSHPQAYGMAWLACRNATRALAQQDAGVPPLAPDAVPMGLPEPNAVTGACSGLSVERWAQLAPDNAAPWLELAALAQQRGDGAQAIDAMYHAGLARSLNTGWGWLPAMLAGVLPEDGGLEAGRMQLMLDVTGEQSRLVSLSGLESVGSHCNAAGISDANTHQQCERMAQLMMGRSSNVSERLIGVGLAERLGMPANQMPVSRREVSAALQWISDDFQGAMAQPQGCEGLRHINRWLMETSRAGEWQAFQARAVLSR